MLDGDMILQVKLVVVDTKANSLYESCLQEIMVVVFIKTNIQYKAMNTTFMIPCRHVQ